MYQPSKAVYTFGDFRLNPSDRLLLRNGEPVPLTPKAFDALLLLVQSAGHLVEKDDFMKQLWPDTFVGDDALAQIISLLRKALATGNATQALIVTIPRRGYRFSDAVHLEPASVSQQGMFSQRELPRSFETASENASSGATIEPVDGQSGFVSGSSFKTEPDKTEQNGSTSLHGLALPRLWLVAATILTGVLAGALTYALLSPPSVPRVIRTTQLTHSGRVDPWGRLIGDGSRLYFLEREGDHWNLVQTSLSGGETQIVPVPFRNTVLLDLSPDHSNFLAANFPHRETEMPLWIWPVQGGAPTRIGDLNAYDAAWHADGQQVVYAKDDGVYLANLDGSHPRLFAPTHGRPGRFAWSPDGRILRFSVFPVGAFGSSLWEMHSDGTNLHEILPHWNNPDDQCCGSWTPDGAYFFFGAGHGSVSGLWALQERARFLRRGQAEPFSIASGEPDLHAPPVVSADLRRIYVFGSTYRYEVVSYDRNSKRFTTVLPGSRVRSSTFSPDGQWLAYHTTDGVLWRAKSDGSLRRPLTSQLLHAQAQAWSPDGKQIAFLNQSLECVNKLFLIPAEGGAPQQLFPNECEQFDPTWSPDGKVLTFARSDRAPNGAPTAATIELLNLSTKERSTLPGSTGMRAPSWSPDGHYLAAITEDRHRIMLLDLRTYKWTDLYTATMVGNALLWSRDQAYLYFEDLLAPNQPIYRIRLRDREREEVVNFESYIRAGVARCELVDLAPDGSPIISLLRNQADVYALDLAFR